jgi:putative salt-induced outer membrane protein YdiY
MKRQLSIVLGSILLLAVLGSARAQDQPAGGSGPAASEGGPSQAKAATYHSSTSFSFLLARGNNNTLSFGFDTEQNLVLRSDSFNLKGSVIYAQANGLKKNEIYYAHLKVNHQLSEGAYLLSLARFERDVLAGYPSRLSFSAGGGWTWVKTDKVNFYSDLAVGWSSENAAAKVSLTDPARTILEKTTNSSFVSTIMTNRLTFNLTSNSQIVQQEVIFVNLEDASRYRLSSLSSLSASFSRYFGLKMSVQVNYERKPVTGYKNADVFLLSSLVIAI